jgi:hypothetical protein
MREPSAGSRLFRTRSKMTRAKIVCFLAVRMKAKTIWEGFPFITSHIWTSATCRNNSHVIWILCLYLEIFRSKQVPRNRTLKSRYFRIYSHPCIGVRRQNGAWSTGTPATVLLQPLCTKRPWKRISPQRPGPRGARIINETRKPGRASPEGSPTPPFCAGFIKSSQVTNHQ